MKYSRCLLSLFFLAKVVMAQGVNFSEVPTNEWWRSVTPKEKAAFLKGLRAGMLSDPSYLVSSDAQLSNLIDSFSRNDANLQASITSAFAPRPSLPPSGPKAAAPSVPSNLPDPPVIPSPSITTAPALTNQGQTANVPPAARQNPSVSNGLFKVGGGVTAPALLYKVEPEYSEAARKAHLEGTVVLYIEVASDGSATNPKVVRSLGLGLDEKAIEAVRKWKFRPGYKDGQPVTVAATIEVNFRFAKTPKEQNQEIFNKWWERIQSEKKRGDFFTALNTTEQALGQFPENAWLKEMAKELKREIKASIKSPSPPPPGNN